MTERAGIGIKKDYKLLNWEQNDFPIACTKCLGEGKFLRMLKRFLGAECRICTRPFTVFRWTLQHQSARQKKTEICSTCAKINNCCQVCVHDLQFDLPLELRNKLLGDQKVELLMSEGNKEIFAHLANEQLDALQLPYAQLDAFLKKRAEAETGLLAVEPEGPQIDAVDDEAEVLVDPTNIRKYVVDRYAHLNAGQREMARAIDGAQKVVGGSDDIRTVSIWFVEEREVGIVQKKVEDIFEEPFTVEWRDNEALLTFESKSAAERFIRIFDGKFVIRGKMLNVDWHVEYRSLPQKLVQGFFGLVTDKFLPKEPTPESEALLHKRANPPKAVQ
jgi:pre-mRNA-splicing factor RBM22/SLT11